MDAFLQMMSSSAVLAGGGWSLLFAFAMWVVHGFTSRGWSTPKQRERADARADKIRDELDAFRESLAAERKQTADKALEALGVAIQTISRQQATISNFDDLVGKIPVVTTPSTGVSSQHEIEADPQ